MATYSFAYLLCLGVLSAAALAPLKELNDGNKMPAIALGTGLLNNFVIGLSNVQHEVYDAIEAGFRHIDTASIYQDERDVGLAVEKAIKNGLVKREDLFISTKLWNHEHARNKVVPSLRKSLSSLGLDYVDLYFIHFPVAFNEYGTPTNEDFLETWKGMEEAKELGLAKSIGVANFNASQIDRILANSKVKPVVNQIEVNPTLTQESLVSHCQQKDIVVMAYCPYGFIFNKFVKNPPPPRDDDPALVAIAQKYGKVVSQIILKYLLQRDLVPVPHDRKKENIIEDINIFDFELTKEEMETIGKFNKNTRVISRPSWNASIYYPFVEY